MWRFGVFGSGGLCLLLSHIAQRRGESCTFLLDTSNEIAENCHKSASDLLSWLTLGRLVGLWRPAVIVQSHRNVARKCLIP